MLGPRLRATGARLLSEYSMVIALLLLAAYYSLVTIDEQHPEGAAGGAALSRELKNRFPRGARVLVVAGAGQLEAELAASTAQRLTDDGLEVVAEIHGQPMDARSALQQIVDRNGKLDAVAASPTAASWSVLENVGGRFPVLGDVPVVVPHSYRWPNFLMANNLLNIANQIAIIAIMAIGMTMVIITGGIDLSVGSLLALSAVTSTLLIRDFGGAEYADTPSMVLCCIAAIVLCGIVGLFSGVFVTTFAVPSFIVTLSVMLMASGLARTLAEDQSIYQLPDRFVWLGRGASLASLPNAVVLMVVLYIAAHILMRRMTLGRYIYAVGGNAQAARLSGVRVERILLFVYCVSGALAGLGGVIMASQLKSGSPTYGLMYEMYVIAAVVVGGTSLSGGQGKILGTLIGAFIIAVIQNGMNLTGVGSRSQLIVFGAVILGAVLFDRLKKQGWVALERVFAGWARKKTLAHSED
jgi:ribose transport system permease protein